MLCSDDILSYPLFLCPLFPLPFIYNSPPFMKMLHGLLRIFYIGVSTAEPRREKAEHADGQIKNTCHLFIYQMTVPTRQSSSTTACTHPAPCGSIRNINCNNNIRRDGPDGMLLRIFNSKYDLEFSEFAKWQKDNGGPVGIW